MKSCVAFRKCVQKIIMNVNGDQIVEIELEICFCLLGGVAESYSAGLLRRMLLCKLWNMCMRYFKKLAVFHTSTPAFWCRIFQSRIFLSRIFSVPLINFGQKFGWPLPLEIWGPKTSKVRREFGQLRDLIANVSGTQQDVVNRKTALRTIRTLPHGQT